MLQWYFVRLWNPSYSICVNKYQHLPKYLLIFLQNKQTTQLMERIRKIESQRLAIQKLVVQGLAVLDCLMDFLIKILAELSP